MTVPPDGMREVTRDDFFARLYADKRDIMPDNHERESTTWRLVSGRVAWGWSAPGWANPGDKRAWFVKS